MSTTAKQEVAKQETAIALFHELGLAIAEMDDTFNAHGQEFHPHSKQALLNVILAAGHISSALLDAVGVTGEQRVQALLDQIQLVDDAREALRELGAAHN